MVVQVVLLGDGQRMPGVDDPDQDIGDSGDGGRAGGAGIGVSNARRVDPQRVRRQLRAGKGDHHMIGLISMAATAPVTADQRHFAADDASHDGRIGRAMPGDGAHAIGPPRSDDAGHARFGKIARR